MITAAKETPNEAAQRLMGRSYLSYSSVALYQSCPLRWYFKYVAGLSEETVSASLVFGGSIHAAVQRHFEDLLAGNPPPTLDELRTVYRASWQERCGKGVSFGKGDDEASLDVLAGKMLSAFQASDIATPTGTILGAEEEIVGQLLPGCPDLLARLDLVVETENAVVVTDFKTSRSRWSADQADDSATQLLLYLELARLLVPEKEVRVQFVEKRHPKWSGQ